MDANAIGDTAINPAAPPPVQQVAKEEPIAESPSPEPEEDSGKRLDLYA
jgi:hypothetical protein